MKVGIIGSRTFDDYYVLKSKILNDLDVESISSIVSGGAKGADSLAETFANEFNIPMTIFKPDWKKYGKRAGFIRNEDIVKGSDVIFAFWDGESKGTKNSIDFAKKINIPTVVVIFGKENERNNQGNLF